MKKQLLMVAVVLFVATMTVSADTYPEFLYPKASFRPISARSEAMGGAGLATAIGNDRHVSRPGGSRQR